MTPRSPAPKKGGRTAWASRDGIPIPAWVPFRYHCRYVSEAQRLDLNGEPMGEEHAASVIRALKKMSFKEPR